jgi:site-specific recombinase XerD
MYLNKLIRKIIERTKDSLLREKHITLHCLRHSIATHMVDNGAGIDFVRQFLGHQDINTTNRYAIQRKRNNQLLKKLFV